MRTYKNRNDVPDNKIELVNKEDIVKRLEGIGIALEEDAMTAVDALLSDLKK